MGKGRCSRYSPPATVLSVFQSSSRCQVNEGAEQILPDLDADQILPELPACLPAVFFVAPSEGRRRPPFDGRVAKLRRGNRGTLDLEGGSGGTRGPPMDGELSVPRWVERAGEAGETLGLPSPPTLPPERG